MEFIKSPTRNLLFTGKGGVGKTSMACATAIALAERGKSVLLVSTDPASNLDEVLGVSLNSHPKRIESVANLFAMNIDPEQAAREYRERMVAPYRGVLPDAAVQSMEEQFSGSCTLEIAAFDEFAKLLGDAQATRQFDHVVFDTAPTGHTLRLLTLPSAWSGFMDSNTSGTSCLGPLAGLQAQHATYRSTVQALADRRQTTTFLVARPEMSALREAARTHCELHAMGIENQHLIVNGMFEATELSDPIANAMQARCETAISNLPPELQNLPRTLVPLAANSLIGVAALRGLTRPRNGGTPTQVSHPDRNVSQMPTDFAGMRSLGSIIDELATQRQGVILTMGKGGVGKTSIAAAVAVGLAGKGLRVHLSTTDPAAHLATTLAEEKLDGMTVSRIDPATVTAEYRDEVMRTAGANLDEQGRQLLAEDLRSPCTEEIAVFRSFAQAVAEGETGFVVLDTAPTGHTILLLDAALAYHREVTRQTHQMPESVEQLLPRLRDPDFTRILIVTLPESTPVHEAARLQQDLIRADIQPFAWVINQSISPLVLRDPVLMSRQLGERALIEEVVSEHSERTALVPWMLDAPAGLKGLRRLIDAASSIPLS